MGKDRRGADRGLGIALLALACVTACGVTFITGEGGTGGDDAPGSTASAGGAAAAGGQGGASIGPGGSPSGGSGAVGGAGTGGVGGGSAAGGLGGRGGSGGQTTACSSCAQAFALGGTAPGLDKICAVEQAVFSDMFNCLCGAGCSTCVPFCDQAGVLTQDCLTCVDDTDGCDSAGVACGLPGF